MAKILIVDDSELDRGIAGACVEESGLTPVYAEHGNMALQVIESESPDFVLTDLQMPEMDGLELVKRIKANHPTMPIILMTAHGSEEIAVGALKAGASSYVPKQNLRQGLGEAITIVREAADAIAERRHVRALLQHSESLFVLGYERGATSALVGHLRDALAQLHSADTSELLQVCTALTEAIHNAIDHGNLELDSALREEAEDTYRSLGNARSVQPPYRDRRVRVTHRLTPTEVTYTIRDDGPGFNLATLPDPTDPENLLRPCGRGLMLIHAFMDEVTFNEAGNEIRLVKVLST